MCHYCQPIWYLSKLRRALTCDLLITLDICFLFDKDKNLKIGFVEELNGLYHIKLTCKINYSQKTLVEAFRADSQKVFVLHQRLGHPSLKTMHILFLDVCKNIYDNVLLCERCEMAKHKSTISLPSRILTSSPFKLVHRDVWGPSPIVGISGVHWFITFIDDYLKFSWTFLLKHKYEVSAIVQHFFLVIMNACVKHFRNDNTRDYFNTTLDQHFSTKGVIHESSCAYTPQ